MRSIYSVVFSYHDFSILDDKAEAPTRLIPRQVVLPQGVGDVNSLFFVISPGRIHELVAVCLRESRPYTIRKADGHELLRTTDPDSVFFNHGSRG